MDKKSLNLKNHRMWAEDPPHSCLGVVRTHTPSPYYRSKHRQTKAGLHFAKYWHQGYLRGQNIMQSHTTQIHSAAAESSQLFGNSIFICWWDLSWVIHTRKELLPQMANTGKDNPLKPLLLQYQHLPRALGVAQVPSAHPRCHKFRAENSSTCLSGPE